MIVYCVFLFFFCFVGVGRGVVSCGMWSMMFSLLSYVLAIIAPIMLPFFLLLHASNSYQNSHVLSKDRIITDLWGCVYDYILLNL